MIQSQFPILFFNFIKYIFKYCDVIVISRLQLLISAEG